LELVLSSSTSKLRCM